MNSAPITLPPTDAAMQRVEFFRLPAPGKRDPHFGLSRGWYYKRSVLSKPRWIRPEIRLLRKILTINTGFMDYFQLDDYPLSTGRPFSFK